MTMPSLLSRLMLAFILLASVIFMAPIPASAEDPFKGVKAAQCAKARDSTICQTSAEDPLTGQNGIFIRLTRLVAVIAGAVAVIVIVLSGFRYITSAGDPEQISKSKNTLIFSAVGLVVIVLAQSIISYILNRI